MSKYNARRVEYDGIKFDSKMESQYYIYLKDLKKNGEIKDFELQPSFVLQPNFEKNGIKYRAITYKADFKIIHNNGDCEIVDIKGLTTPAFLIKSKMFNYTYEEELKLITYSKIDGGWITLEQLKENRRKRKKEKKRK